MSVVARQTERPRHLKVSGANPTLSFEPCEDIGCVALEDGIRMLDLAVDLDPYLFHGRPSGVLTRLSSSALLNVTAGAGSIVPTFVVEGPA